MCLVLIDAFVNMRVKVSAEHAVVIVSAAVKQLGWLMLPN